MYEVNDYKETYKCDDKYWRGDSIILQYGVWVFKTMLVQPRYALYISLIRLLTSLSFSDDVSPSELVSELVGEDLSPIKAKYKCRNSRETRSHH